MKDHCLYFQPILDVVAMRPHGYEVLSRFTDMASKRLTGPDKNLGHDQWTSLDANVAGILMKSLEKGQLSKPGLFVNVSASTLSSPSKFEEWAGMMEVFQQMYSGRLTLEVHEDVETDDLDACWPRLAGLGAAIAMDDACTSKATIERLIRFPWDVCKIDVHSLFSPVGDEVRNHADKNGTLLIVEQVETELQSIGVKMVGINLQQGFYHGHPKPIAHQFHIHRGGVVAC